jgi:hypothetical protein
MRAMEFSYLLYSEIKKNWFKLHVAVLYFCGIYLNKNIIQIIIVAQIQHVLIQKYQI